MSNHARKAIFLVLLAVFFLAGAPIALYSCGYRFRFDTLKITQSGGIYVKSEPGDARIFLDGKEIKNESGILNSGTFIKGLIPDKYDLEVVKEGYIPFKATAKVMPLQADPFEKIILVPDKSELYFSGDILDFYINSGELITIDRTGKMRYGNQIISGQNFEAFTADGKGIITSIISGGEKIFFHVSLSNPKVSTNINEIFWNLKISRLKLPGRVSVKAVSPHPFDQYKFVVSTKTALYILDAKQSSITRSGEGAKAITREGPSIYLQREGSFDSFNVTLKTSSSIMGTEGAGKITVSPNNKKTALLWDTGIFEIYDMDGKKSLRFDFKEIQPIKDIFWHKSSSHVFILTESGNLLFLQADKETLPFQLIAKGARKAEYSDGKLYVLSDREIRTLKF